MATLTKRLNDVADKVEQKLVAAKKLKDKTEPSTTATGALKRVENAVEKLP